MIRHVVFYRFRPEVDRHERHDALDGLRGLAAVIDAIGSLEVGRDVLQQPRSWDAVLVATFADLDALDAYQKHPRHRAVADRLTSLCESIGSVDYPVVPSLAPPPSGETVGGSA